MRVRINGFCSSTRHEDAKHPQEFEIVLGFNMLSRKARYYIECSPDGTVDGRDFTNALRALADTFDADFAKMEPVQPEKTKSGLILPGTLEKK